MNLKELKTETKLLLISLLSGLLAAFLIYFFINEKEKFILKKIEPVKVVVAAKYIPAWSEITEEMLDFADMPRNWVTDAHILNPKKAIKKVAVAPFIKGEPLLINKITERGEELNTAIPLGLRAVSIGVDDITGVSYMIKPGDYVDLLLTYEDVREKKICTATLLQAVKVIAIGNNFKIQEKENIYSTVTFAVTPEEAEIITFAREKGKISLALRPIGDKTVEKIRQVSFADLLNQIRKTEKGEEEKIIIQKREEF